MLWAILFLGVGVLAAGFETARRPWVFQRVGYTERGRGFGQATAALGVNQLLATGVIVGIWTVGGPIWAFGVVVAAALAVQSTLRFFAERSPG